jgi:hypothetical protein
MPQKSNPVDFFCLLIILFVSIWLRQVGSISVVLICVQRHPCRLSNHAAWKLHQVRWKIDATLMLAAVLLSCAAMSSLITPWQVCSKQAIGEYGFRAIRKRDRLWTMPERRGFWYRSHPQGVGPRVHWQVHI